MLEKTLFAIALVAVGAPAHAQGVGDLEAAIADRSKPATRPLDVKSATECPAGTSADVVVCAPAGPGLRLDRDVLEAARPEAPPPAVDPRRTVNVQRCGIGTKLCDSGAVPVSAIALTVAKAAVMAVEGEDWKEAFRDRPEEYQRYLDAKRKRESRPRVSIGVLPPR